MWTTYNCYKSQTNQAPWGLNKKQKKTGTPKCESKGIFLREVLAVTYMQHDRQVE